MSYSLSKLMCLFTLILPTSIAVAGSSTLSEPTPPSMPMDFVANWIVGEYVVIGKKPGTDQTYLGHMTIRRVGDGTQFSRTVNNHTDDGTISLDAEALRDGEQELHIRFALDGEQCRADYRWHMVGNNSARLTGYVYFESRKTAAGVEALFPIR